jgi:tRNA pseudouridine55 synthase
MARARSDLDGVLPIDKPAGPTSHDVVARARRALGLRRIGHTGTLDPFASGLLLLCLGPATRLAEYLTALPKTYRAVMRLGQTTDTDDLTGEVIGGAGEGAPLPTEAEVRAALESLRGPIEQLPPLYSAKKVAGERMYAAARRGEVPERTPVRVTIHRIELLRYDAPDAEFEVECSSGTYIRAIARDVGDALGVGGHLHALRRTAIGAHRVESAVPLDALDEAARAQVALIAPLDAVAHLPRADVDEVQAGALAMGRAVAAPPDLPEHGLVRVASPAGALLAIAEASAGVLRPKKVFA